MLDVWEAASKRAIIQVEYITWNSNRSSCCPMVRVIYEAVRQNNKDQGGTILYSLHCLQYVTAIEDGGWLLIGKVDE